MSSTTAPAFTAVAARRTLTGSEQSAPKSSAAPWPREVREWVSRAFADANPAEHGEISTKLKQIITDRMNDGSMYTVDWTTMPLPQEFLRRERQQAILGAAYPQNPIFYQPPVQPPPPFLEDTRPAMPSPKKRKSSEMGVDDDERPWRKSNGGNLLEDRISYANSPNEDRADKRNKKRREDTNNKANSKYQNSLELRKQRFDLQSQTPPWRSRSVTPPPDALSGPVIGTNEELEKKYFRLTSAPKPEAVRPQRVLEQTLKLLKKKWRENASYPYICDQFKSMRQDLTVQHIKNDFTVSVYELHARIALERKDLGEYNQCQTQLRALYSQGLQGHPTEFLAYRILYFIHTSNKTDLNDVMAELTPAEKEDESVKHALEVRSAVALGNYHKLFRLYVEPPNMSGYIMDGFIDRERLAALAKIGRAYKKALALRFLAEELVFESTQQCYEWLVKVGAQDLLEQKEDGTVWLNADLPAYRLFEAARTTAFSKVDIKGQI